MCCERLDPRMPRDGRNRRSRAFLRRNHDRSHSWTLRGSRRRKSRVHSRIRRRDSRRKSHRGSHRRKIPRHGSLRHQSRRHRRGNLRHHPHRGRPRHHVELEPEPKSKRGPRKRLRQETRWRRWISASEFPPPKRRLPGRRTAFPNTTAKLEPRSSREVVRWHGKRAFGVRTSSCVFRC